MARETYAQTATQLHSVTSKITAWLDSQGYVTHDRGTDTPLVTADVPASALADLGRLDGVASVDLTYPTVPNGFSWFDAVKGPAAQSFVSSAAGNPFCNGEGYKSDSYMDLSLSGILDSSAQASTHTRWTSELISATAGNTSMAPGAEFYLPAYELGSDGYDDYDAWSWCFSNLGIWNMNRSASTGTGAQALLAPDMALDYYAVNWPYPLITTSAGNCEDEGGYEFVDCDSGDPYTGAYTGNRSYNTLVVGSSDSDGTPQTADDFMSNFSQYLNPVTTHNDFELPNLVAPGSDIYDTNIDSASTYNEGTSASSAITMGGALLMEMVDSSITYYPEVEKALILDASTHPVVGTRPMRLGLDEGDQRQGVGLLNVQNAIEYANPEYIVGPNATPVALGHWVNYYDFSTDFTSGVSQPFNIAITVTGRLRAVIAWDATTQGCNEDGSECEEDLIDADLDLHVSQYVDGVWQNACYSPSYDSSWEFCDIPVTAGQQYKAEIVDFSPNAAGTYVGIAWSNYDPTNE